MLRLSSRAVVRAIALALIGLAGYVLWQTAAMPAGTLALPGPGFFPAAIAILMGLAALAVLIAPALGASGPGESTSLGGADAWATLAALLLAGLLFEAAGAAASLGLLVALMGWRVARTSPARAIVAGVIAAAATWAVFVRLLGVQLPAGSLWGG